MPVQFLQQNEGAGGGLDFDRAGRHQTKIPLCETTAISYGPKGSRLQYFAQWPETGSGAAKSWFEERPCITAPIRVPRWKPNPSARRRPPRISPAPTTPNFMKC